MDETLNVTRQIQQPWRNLRSSDACLGNLQLTQCLKTLSPCLATAGWEEHLVTVATMMLAEGQPSCVKLNTTRKGKGILNDTSKPNCSNTLPPVPMSQSMMKNQLNMQRKLLQMLTGAMFAHLMSDWEHWETKKKKRCFRNSLMTIAMVCLVTRCCLS